MTDPVIGAMGQQGNADRCSYSCSYEPNPADRTKDALFTVNVTIEDSSGSVLSTLSGSSTVILNDLPETYQDPNTKIDWAIVIPEQSNVADLRFTLYWRSTDANHMRLDVSYPEGTNGRGQNWGQSFVISTTTGEREAEAGA